MAYRIVKINSRSKLETQLNYLVCRNDKETRILLDDIAVLIIENQQVCITTALLSELMNHNVRVVFCDSKHNPQGELSPYTASYNTYAKIQSQISWSQEIKNRVWREIIRQKITNQAKVLHYMEKEDAYGYLLECRVALTDGDTTNREGLAAKTYFSALFGNKFDRRSKSDKKNIYLNYGYSIILSAVNRELSSFGYLTPIGIHHKGETNPFNFGCDLMEPFRPFVDLVVAKETVNDDNYKTEMMKLMTEEIRCRDKNSLIENAIHDYVLSVLSALNNDFSTPIFEVTFKHEQL